MQATLSQPGTLPITEAFNNRYQATTVLSLQKDAMASGFLLDTFSLRGDFKALEINVLANDAPLKAQLEKPDSTTWIVRLPRPLPLSRIRIQELALSNLQMAEEFILAGYFDHLLAESVLSVGAAAVVKDKATQIREKALGRFQAGKDLHISAGDIDIYPVVGDKVMEQSIATVTNNSAINNLVLDAFAIKARDGVAHSRRLLLAARHAISVYVTSQPQACSVHLAPVVNDQPQPASATALPSLNLASNQSIVPLDNADALWQTAVQDYLDTNATSTDSHPFKLALIFRSDNPCQFERRHFSNSYRLLFRDTQIYAGKNPQAPDAEYRHTFPGSQWQSQSFELRLPESAILQSAVLPFKPALQKNAFMFTGQPPSIDWLATASGVELTTGQWTGGTFELDSAQAVHYLLVPLMATAEKSVCTLEIREDIQGKPAGSILTAQSLTLTKTGSRAWMVIRLEETLRLYQQKLWWLLKTSQGSAIQFVEDNPQGSGITHFNLSDSGGPGQVFRVTREKKVRPYFARDNSTGTKLHAFLQHGQQWLPLANSAVGESNYHQIDLLPLLQAHGASLQGKATIHLATLLQGNALLYPPEISYELAPFV